MKKVMFNDRYGLTYAVMEGCKTNMRRIEGDIQFQLAATAAEDFTYEEATGCIVMCCQGVEIFRHKCRYNVGEVVAIAECYFYIRNFVVGEEYDDRLCEAYEIEYTEDVVDLAGWSNKMFVRADLMPHQIRITGIKCERLQNISEEDCMKEGIYRDYADTKFPPREFYDYDGNEANGFNTPRKAFASLIDKVSGKGTWKRNPWVVAYEFELVKQQDSMQNIAKL